MIIIFLAMSARSGKKFAILSNSEKLYCICGLTMGSGLFIFDKGICVLILFPYKVTLAQASSLEPV